MGLVLRHLPFLAFALAILFLSGGTGSADATGSWAEPLLRSVLGLSAESAEHVHRGIRKAGHVIAYAVLAWLALRSIRGARPTTSGRAWLAFAVAVCVSAADETLQSASPSRGGSALDVAIDASGAAALLLLLRRRAGSRTVAGSA